MLKRFLKGLKTHVLITKPWVDVWQHPSEKMHCVEDFSQVVIIVRWPSC